MKTPILLAGLAGAFLVGVNLPLHSEKPPTIKYFALPCHKPWLSEEDERATCAIEAAQAQHAEGKPRPTHKLKTGWKQ